MQELNLGDKVALHDGSSGKEITYAQVQWKPFVCPSFAYAWNLMAYVRSLTWYGISLCLSFRISLPSNLVICWFICIYLSIYAHVYEYFLLASCIYSFSSCWVCPIWYQARRCGCNHVPKQSLVITRALYPSVLLSLSWSSSILSLSLSFSHASTL